MCVLDTYRQSEIYVARGESGALKYYRFASRARVCIFMRGPTDEDGNTERETKWRKGERERSVMKRREERIKKRLTGLKKNSGEKKGARLGVVEIEMEKHGGVGTVIPESGIKKNLVV